MSSWNLPDLWDRLKHDLAFRVATLYAGGSWFIVEALDTLQLQPSVIRRTALVLAVLFVPVAGAAWLWQRRLRAPRGVRRWAVALPALLLLASGLWAFRARATGDVPPAAERIAVLPFHATGSDEVRELGTGMVDLLTAALDQVGPLRTIASRTVLARVGGAESTLSMDDARQAAREIGAGSVLTGSVTSFQGQANLTAELRDVRTGVVMAAADVRGPQADMLKLTDRLAVGLLRDLWRSSNPLPTIRTAALTTESPAALRAWLRGEEHLRGTRFDSAAAAFEQAVAEDSTFALAWARLGEIGGWVDESPERIVAQRQHLERALALADRLPPREQSLVRAHALRLRGDFAAFDSLAVYVQRYPDDPLGWYHLGDARYHAEYLGRFDVDQVIQPFLEATRLDPAFGVGLNHVLDAAISYGDRQLFESTLPLYQRFGNPERVAQLRVRHRIRWAAPDSILPALAAELRRLRLPADRAEAVRLVGVVGQRLRTELGLDPVLYLAAADTLAAVFASDRAMQASAAGRRSWLHGATLDYQRALREIDRQFELLDLPPEMPRALLRSGSRLAMLEQERADTALMREDATVLASWEERRPDLTLGMQLMHALAVGNGAEARRLKKLVDDQPFPRHWRDLDLDAAATAYTGWMEIMLGDTVGGLALLDDGVRRLGFEDANYAGVPWDAYGAVLARVPGREAEGVGMLRSHVSRNAQGTSHAYLDMAQALERLGRPSEAAEAYQHALRFLAHGGPAAAPLRAQAQQSLTRLAAARPR